ncbi:hypothetical protein [Pendulispora albinea]|uniref:Carboxypeptidase regulatory-like domain-containing protein n=1 Tax=Pendulispora albinea TaxID=2741071 RepID=A0ABZ2LW80_9BACT
MILDMLTTIERKSRNGHSKIRNTVFAIALGASMIGCGEPTPPPSVAVVVRARAENGSPVGAVEIFMGPRLVARTENDGRAQLDVRGAEGETFSLQVKCPEGFRSPATLLPVRSFGVGAAAPPEYNVVCRETRHTLVVAVRATDGPNLPIYYLGKEVARTDRSGGAHVSMDMEVHDRVELMLGTAGKEFEKVHPQNPAATFEMPDHDDIQVFEMKFTRDKPKVVRRAKPSGPVVF